MNQRICPLLDIVKLSGVDYLEGAVWKIAGDIFA